MTGRVAHAASAARGLRATDTRQLLDEAAAGGDDQRVVDDVAFGGVHGAANSAQAGDRRGDEAHAPCVPI